MDMYDSAHELKKIITHKVREIVEEHKEDKDFDAWFVVVAGIGHFLAQHCEDPAEMMKDIADAVMKFRDAD